MEFAVINVEDPVGKTVGRRRLRNAPKAAMALQHFINQVRQSQGYGAICRRGVFRFRSHQEADKWMIKELVQRAVRNKN
jgi:hypothetical protein